MANKNKNCFVISPIGQEGSEIRREADDLFDLIIEPALHPYNFDVIRTDRIPRPSVITSDIIQLVQTADLCLIDLTRQNPNVFYECGRRHETGRPFIQLIRKGEDLPFDVSGIRTIEYDLSTPRSTHDSVRAIQRFVEEIGAGGFEPASSGESLSSIASSLERIERKLNQIMPTTPALITSQVSSTRNPFDILTNPREVFMEAITNGDITTARACLPRLEQLFGLSDELADMAALLAQAGDTLAADILRRVLEQKDNLSESSLRFALAGLAGFYINTDKEKEGLLVIEPLVKSILDGGNLSTKDEAYFLNQLQRLRYGAGELELALSSAERVVQLCPGELSYLYNLSLIYHRLDLLSKAAETVDSYMNLPDKEPDDDHLSHAIRVYAKAGRTEDAKAAFQKLRERYPAKANRVLFDSTIRKIVESA